MQIRKAGSHALHDGSNAVLLVTMNEASRHDQGKGAARCAACRRLTPTAHIRHPGELRESSRIEWFT
jgi:hypothetical protein